MTMHNLISTIIKTMSVCDGDVRSVVGGRDWLAVDIDGLASWLVTVGVVSQSWADAEWYRCACLYCTQGLAGRGDVTGISAASAGSILVVVSCSYHSFNISNVVLGIMSLLVHTGYVICVGSFTSVMWGHIVPVPRYVLLDKIVYIRCNIKNIICWVLIEDSDTMVWRRYWCLP